MEAYNAARPHAAGCITTAVEVFMLPDKQNLRRRPQAKAEILHRYICLALRATGVHAYKK